MLVVSIVVPTELFFRQESCPTATHGTLADEVPGLEADDEDRLEEDEVPGLVAEDEEALDDEEVP
jgi:hypothetical protein